jgi:hypothetical protein
MSTNDQPREPAGLADLAYGSVWLVSAEGGDPGNLSPLALHALDTADAVIHDVAVASQILDLVKPPHYREAAAPDQAIRRSIKLAEDGWRVVLLVADRVIPRAIAAAPRFIEHNIAFRIVVPDRSDTVGCDWPLPLLLFRKSRSPDRTDPRLLVLPPAFPQAEAPADAEYRHAPPGFSLSGLAG